MYSEAFLDHFRNPRNIGRLDPPAVSVTVENPACGDTLRLSALIENGSIARAAYQVRGCTAAIAAGSALTEWMIGKPPAALAVLEAAVIDEAVGGLIPESKHAAVLCVDAARLLARSI